VLRSRIILLLEKLGSDGQVARDLQVTSRTVRRWRERFVGGGTDALWRDAPGRGRKTSRRPDVDGAVAEYLGRKQRGDVVPSLRALARSLGIGLGSVHRLLTRPRRSGD
jgi:transposase